MTDRVIEPSEIILETPNRARENITHVNPWIRCIARFFDYALFFLLLLASRKFFSGHLPFGQAERFIPFEYFVWIPIEALLLHYWGTTPGKFFLKTKLKPKKRLKLDYITALRRSFSVWMRGLGLGIPVINALCMLGAYHKLKVFHITSWDRDDHIQVTHYPIGKWRIYVAVFVAVTGILYYYQEKELELQYARKIVRPVNEYSVQTVVGARFYIPTENNSCCWRY